MIHSYPWYPQDWRTSEAVLAMTAEQRDVYRNLLDVCWMEGSLPSNERLLMKLSLADRTEWRRAWPIVQGQFELRGERWYHQKVDERRPELERWHEQKRNAGLCSAEARRARSFQRTFNGRSTDVPTAVQRAFQPSVVREERADPSSSSSFESFPVSNKTAEAKITRNDDDDDRSGKAKAQKVWTSERDELAAMIRDSTGEAPDRKLIQNITESLDLRSGTLRAYLDDIRPRLGRLAGKPGPGFFLSYARAWGGDWQRPVEAREAPAVDERGRCAECGGIGRLADGYCGCKLGRDLQRVESRPKPEPVDLSGGPGCGAQAKEIT